MTGRGPGLPAAAILILSSLPAGCGDAAGSGDAPEPPQVDTSTLDGPALRAAVLETCHGALQHTMDRVAVNVTMPDGTLIQAFAALPRRLRTQTAEQLPRILDGDDAFELAAGGAVADLPAEAARRLHELRTLIDAAALGPLYRAENCTRRGDQLLLQQPGGSECVLSLRPGTLVPERLTGPAADVEFVSFVRTSTTWIAQRLTLSPLGECTLSFRLSELTWDPDLFQRPARDAAAAPPPPPVRVRMPGFSPEHRPRTPEVTDNRARSWIVLDDPGDWSSRARVYAEHHAVLVAQDQQIFGFAGFCRRGQRQVMVIPFRQREGGPALVTPEDWVVEQDAGGRVLVVFPEGGDLGERIDNGSRLLRQALEAHGGGTSEPIVAQPYLHLQEGEPSAEQLRTAVVRMSVAVQ